MKLSLKQIDILNNRYIYPNVDYSLKSINEDTYFTNMDIRINSRLEQINNLKDLLNSDLNDIEYYNKVLDVYNIRYKYNFKLNTPFVSFDNATIIVNSTSDTLFDDKIYTLKEIISVYIYNNIMLDGVYLTEYNENYMKKFYDLSLIEKVNYKEFLSYYNYLKKELNNKNMLNKNMANIIKNELSEERIQNDLISLINMTNNEISEVQKEKKLCLKLTEIS